MQLQDFYAPVGTDSAADPIVPFNPTRTPGYDPVQEVVDSSKPYVPPDLPQAPTQTAPTPSAAAAPLTQAEPVPARRGAGFGILIAGVGAGVGAYLGGAYGAGAGLLLTGAGRNIWRAKRLWSTTGHPEAVKSGTMALFGLGIGGWLAYKAWEGRKAA